MTRTETSYWIISADGAPDAYLLARSHYSAAKNKHPKIRQFVGPGEKMVLFGWFCKALFAWRKSRFRLDSQVGIECVIFRNESTHQSSDMIREAVSLAWERWPRERLYTHVDAKAIRSSNPGCCFKKAGWRKCGKTKTGLVILELLPTSAFSEHLGPER